MTAFDLVLAVFSASAAILAALLLFRVARLSGELVRAQNEAADARERRQADALHQALAGQTERFSARFEALQLAQTERLAETRETLLGQFAVFQGAVQDKLAAAQAAALEAAAVQQASVQERLTNLQTGVLERLASQARAEQHLLQETLAGMSRQFAERAETLTRTVDGKLGEISGKVAERLDEGFKKTNDTFASVMSRLAVIDEAQKKIEGLASNVVGLQEILGDKKSRGAFGEVQLEALVKNALPPDAYAFQHTLKSGARADCALCLPAPTGKVCVDAKFPLENYRAMFGEDLAARDAARRQFKLDVKKHIDDIAGKYIVPGETGDGAVLFLPAEAVFAEIHAHHPELVEHAQKQRVWLTSPTTLMAVLNTARAVIRDTETRRMAHVIKDELGKLAKDFGRFDERMKKLAAHIEQANKDVSDVRISSDKISAHFRRIERVELESETALPHLPVLDDDR